jgi:hypothetical protein
MKNKKLFRIVGGLVGITFILLGVHLFINPLFGNVLEKINSAVFVIVGGLFVKYGITGNRRR